jgi:catechol 2,3-dioxygenase-like lactoylglutathione lyase family enzyme
MAIQRMDNVGIVFEDLDGAVAFFAELGLTLEGRQVVEGPWVDGVIGMKDAKVEIAMLKTPDGHSWLELSRFITPIANKNPAANAPVNTMGYLRVMFADDLDDTVARLQARGARLVDRIVQYEDMYRLCYIRGPEGVLVGAAGRTRSVEDVADEPGGIGGRENLAGEKGGRTERHDATRAPVATTARSS